MTNFLDISADPLYLQALASLGSSVPAKLAVAPSNNSIAVLPFVDMSGEVGHEHFTDGLTEDIITDLSNVPKFFVIARNSVFAYKGKPTDVRQIAHDLGVKYILEGSARRAGQRLRINVQLIDAGEGGSHIWAERFDRDLADIFVVQDEVTKRIVEAITGKLQSKTSFEKNRPKNLKAYDLVVKSRNLWHVSKSGNDEAKANLQKALALEPDYAEAIWSLANATAFSWLVWGDPEEPNRQDALALAERAVKIDPTDSIAQTILGYIYLNELRWDEAEFCYNKALELNSNTADVLCELAYFYVTVGKPQEAMDFITRAIRLNPQPPSWYYWVAGYAQIVNGLYEEAINTLRREETYRSPSRRILAAALGLVGRLDEAHEEAQYFINLSPHWTISSWAKSQPFKNPSDLQFWIDAYRLAGLPE